MMLSHSFDTGMTSGYVKSRKKFESVLDDLILCGRPTSHPLLLPILTLCNELSSENDERQREQRRELRKLDDVLTGRYGMKPAAHYGPVLDPQLEDISKIVAVSHTEVLQKRPQAWQNVVDNVRRAAIYFWDHVPVEEKDSELQDLHDNLINRLDFLTVKLQGIENYAHVTIERFGILREEVRRCFLSYDNIENSLIWFSSKLHDIITQRESRLNLEIAVDQNRLANSNSRESASMKTLTLLGSFFLPGTFLSSIFSMPFFDFSNGR